VDGLGSRPVRRLDDPLLVQVARRGRPGTEQPGFVGEANVQGAPVSFRVDGDRADPELAERAEDPDCDLAAVGDEHFREVSH